MLYATLKIGEQEYKGRLNARNCVKSLDEPINDEGKEITLIDVKNGFNRHLNL